MGGRIPPEIGEHDHQRPATEPRREIGQSERVIRLLRPVVDLGRSVDAQFHPALENGLVDLDEAGVLDGIEVERDVALESRSGLAEEADVGIDLVGSAFWYFVI